MKNWDQELVKAASTGDVEGVKTALRKGADANARDDNGGFSLVCAAHGGHVEIVRLLLDAADLHTNNNLALLLAAKEGHVEIVRLLLATGAKDRAANDRGVVGLDFAAINGHAEVVRVLVTAENAYSNDHMDNALRSAAANGHPDIVRILLAAGVDNHGINDDILYLAAFYGQAEVVRLLLAAGANVHANCDAALRCAAAHGHAEVVHILLAAGANPVITLENTLKVDRGDVVTTLDGCAAALTQEQRAALLAASRPNEFVRLRAIAAAAVKHRAVRR